ncbi:MAG: hypothetical protein SH818_13845 [Saprospiraceae bacterium]|nr:hypothetical protein [Saprospiraceae bacterium]
MAYSRRKFIVRSLKSGAIYIGLGMTAGACTSRESAQESGKPIDPCVDFSGIGAAELEKRKTFAYVLQSTDPLKQCKGCKLFLPSKPGEKCGGCTLFNGPVDPNGSCTYWVPLD